MRSVGWLVFVGIFLCPGVVNTVKKFSLLVGWRWELHEVSAEGFNAFSFAPTNF